MKKALTSCICILLIFTLCFCDVTYAAKEETFSLRNGIVFGDKKADVKEKEKSLSLKDDEETQLHYKGDIAGYVGDAYYRFNGENGELTELYYAFDASTKAQMNEIFNLIESSCSRQYGDALDSEWWKLYPITDGKGGGAIKLAFRIIDAQKMLNGAKSHDANYMEWVVYGEDGNNVKIELIEYSYDLSYGASCHVGVSYTCFTQAELDAIKNEGDSVF